MLDNPESPSCDVFQAQFGDSPQLVALWAADFAGPQNGIARDQLFQAVDASGFSLRQWVESLHALRAWLDLHGLEMSIEDRIGYVCCAGESAAVGANMTDLPALIAEMLAAYGCERALKKGGEGAF